MKKYFSIFENMSTVDWVLAILITGLLAYAVNMVFPPNGWMIGILAALLLLYIAKRRRDRLTKK
ncbi:MAG: hypothetical protein C0410_04825 [Anaerolinea sp.]|nr:hypothetical protein [Anaerolinea sp.]